MNSSGYPDGDQVLADLGDRFMHSFIDAVDGARDDYAEFRGMKPDWAANSTERHIASFLHDRIWARLVGAVDGMDEVYVVDREPVRELYVGTKYRIRVKRHHSGDRISAYPTQASGEFWSNSAPALEGLETFGLALGYYWDPDLRAVGKAVLSFREGKENPIWVIQLHRDRSTPAGFSWTSVAPDLPEIDLSGVIREVGDGLGS